MATIRIPKDFKDFLKLLTDYEVKFLLIGGYAVGLMGFPRPTGDIDIWIAVEPDNVDRVIEVVRAFGFDDPKLTPSLLLDRRQVLRMGFPPHRIEVICDISGVVFADCYPRRVYIDADGVRVPMIGLADLRSNKLASGRGKDLADLSNLPPTP